MRDAVAADAAELSGGELELPHSLTPSLPHSLTPSLPQLLLQLFSISKV